MIKYTYDTEAEIPEALKGEYANKDGKWVLNIDGVVPKSAHDKFRENNVLLSRERDDLKKIKDLLDEAGITIEDAVRLKGIEKDLDEQKLHKKGDIDKIVQERLKDITGKHEKLTVAQQKKLDQLQHELEVMRIDEAAVAIALKNGLEETAVDDIKARARANFKLVDGKPKALGPDGFELTDDLGHPLTFEKWVTNLKPNYPHLFKRNSGGGGQPGRQGGGAGTTSGKNPWNKDSWNLTEQGRIFKADPQKAEQLKSAAA